MVNLNSLVDEKPRVKKTVQPHEYTHLYGSIYECTSGNSGKPYRIAVDDNQVFYTCPCEHFAFQKQCSHGDQLCERIADGEVFPEAYPSRFDMPVQPWRVVSDTPFYDFDNAPLLDSKPAPRKLTLEEIFSY